MTIPRDDFFNFLFGGGRGIRTDQVDWSKSDTELTVLLGTASGGGLHFRNPADIFTGADLAACRTARDAYFVAPATSAALSEYQGNEFLTIVLNPADSTDNVFETYLPGNVGDPYDNTQWVARTSAIIGDTGPKGAQGTDGPQGTPGVQGAMGSPGTHGTHGAMGPQGVQGLYTVEIYRNVPNAQASITPTGGSIVVATAVVVAPSLWATTLTPAPTGQKTIISRSVVNAATQSGTITPIWSSSFDSGGTGPAGPQGPTGAMGSDGMDGAKGAMGDQGPQGSQGQQGNQGDQGTQGDQGSDGAMGNAGNTGPIGPTGLTGPAAGTDAMARADIATETTERKAADGVLTTAAATADGKAVAADAKAVAADAKAVAADAKAVTNAGDISSEITNRGTAVSNEASARSTADTNLGGRIDGNASEITTVKGIAEAAQTATEVATLIAVETKNRTTNDNLLVEVDTAEGRVRKAADLALGKRIDLLPSGGGGVAGTSTKVVDRSAYNVDSDTIETLTFDMTEHEIVDIIVRTSAVTSTGTAPSLSIELDTALLISYSGSSPAFLPTSNTVSIKQYAALATAGGEVTVKLLRNNAANLAITFGTLEIFLVRASGGGGVIDQGARDATATEVTARKSGDAALGIRLDALAVSGGGGGGGLTETILFDGDVAGSSSNVLRGLYQGASPAVTDEIVVPETGDLLFTVYPKTTNAFAGHYQIAAEDFITRVGADGVQSGQGQNTGFSFPVGQNRAFTVTHRVVGGVKRFLWSTSHDANLTWRLEIIHLTPATSGPSYQPGPAHFRFVGSDRKAAVAARDKYFLGEIALTQAYVDIFSIKTSSYIRVTLDRSVTEQMGTAGNAWNLVLGTDHTNTAVTITPNTPAKTFTLRLPDAGITLDTLAADLDGNARLHAQVAGNGSALVDYDATWGSSPAVGAVSPFRHGGDKSTIERTAWRAEYIANPNFVLVLAYGILEEYQHWAVAVAPAISDWETVLTLIDPPTPNYKPGPTPNAFRGANRAAAVSARDKYLDSVSGITQAFTRIYSDADNYITVSLDATVAKGPKGNKWSMQWGGDSSSAGEIELETFDSLFRATLKWDVNATTLAGLHSEFSGDSKFSSVVIGDDTSVVSVVETFGADEIGNTIFFQGGGRTHIDIPHTWFAHYVDNEAATITLEYESRQEMQVWDVPSIDFRTAFTLLDSPTKPNPFTVLIHDDTAPDNYQWTAVAGSTETEMIQRIAGTVTNPTRGTVRPVIPASGKEIWVRLSKGGNDINTIEMDELILPNGDKADSQVEFRLGVSGIHLRIDSTGHVFVRRTTGTSGNVTVGCDIWYR